MSRTAPMAPRCAPGIGAIRTVRQTIKYTKSQVCQFRKSLLRTILVTCSATPRVLRRSSHSELKVNGSVFDADSVGMVSTFWPMVVTTMWIANPQVSMGNRAMSTGPMTGIFGCEALLLVVLLWSAVVKRSALLIWVPVTSMPTIRPAWAMRVPGSKTMLSTFGFIIPAHNWCVPYAAKTNTINQKTMAAYSMACSAGGSRNLPETSRSTIGISENARHGDQWN